MSRFFRRRKNEKRLQSMLNRLRQHQFTSFVLDSFMNLKENL
jgi:hypothetical protein